MTAYFGLAAWRATRVQLLADWKKGDAGCPRAPEQEFSAIYVAPAIAMSGAACGACSRKLRDVLTESSRFSPHRALGAGHVVSEYERLTRRYIKSAASSDCAGGFHLRARLVPALCPRAASTRASRVPSARSAHLAQIQPREMPEQEK